MKDVYLLLGSNIGDRALWMAKALDLMAKNGVIVLKESATYETEAWGNTGQPSFYNKVVQVQTTLQPLPLLHSILQVETKLGRLRTEKWGPRIIDIDILFYANVVLETDELTIPHPMIAARRFTLLPLAEIAPAFIHPVLNLSVAQLLGACADTLDVRKVDTQP